MIKIICNQCRNEIHPGSVAGRLYMFGESNRKYDITFDGEKNVNGGNIKSTAEYCGNCIRKMGRYKTTMIKEKVKKEDKKPIKMRKEKKIDEGKILALKNAGWNENEIAWEMGIELKNIEEVILGSGGKEE